jgi:hypothetical protein
VVVVEVAGQRLAQLGQFDPHPAVGEVGEHPGVTLSGDHRVQHLAAGHAVQVADHRVEFDLRVFQELDGRLQSFERTVGSSTPRPLEIAAVRSTESARRWIRVTTTVRRLVQSALPLSPEGNLDPPIPPDVATRDAEAVLAFWRAQSASPLGSVIALWDAIEFYVGGTRAPSKFEGAALDRLRDEVPTWLTDEQKARYQDLVGNLNNAPLFVRLREAISQDGVPVSEEEIAVLSRLRKVRNPAQHGRERKTPDDYDLRRAWSIVARLLV